MALKIVRIFASRKSLGLGDRIEILAKPIAKAFHMPCLDDKDMLKPESPCAKRRDKANELGRKIGIGSDPKGVT